MHIRSSPLLGTWSHRAIVPQRTDSGRLWFEMEMGHGDTSLPALTHLHLLLGQSNRKDVEILLGPVLSFVH